MARLLIKGTQAACPTGTGTASTFGSATLVRLVNTAAGADHLVTVVEAANGAVVGTFTLMRSTSEVIEKQSSHAIFAADAADAAAAAGFIGEAYFAPIFCWPRPIMPPIGFPPPPTT